MRSIKPISWTGGQLEIRGRRRLPHFRLDHRAYFITIRLRDSIPIEVQAELHEQKLRLFAQYGHELRDPQRLRTIQNELARAWEWRLDQGHGRCELRDPVNARIVADAIEYFDCDRYALICYCVMPNHAHIVAFFDDAGLIGRTVGSWKKHAADAINARLGRSGRLWQPECFDRLIRDDDELASTVQYVMNNAGMAKLKDWPFQRRYDSWTEKIELMRMR